MSDRLGLRYPVFLSPRNLSMLSIEVVTTAVLALAVWMDVRLSRWSRPTMVAG